ncbi:MAG TPA: ATP synthase F1 subunit gamma [Candidatus Saccharimonadales bacterium]
MPATQLIKTRIRSVKSTRQITKAMELVAASKLRRAQAAVARTADYARAARELLTFLRQSGETIDVALYQQRRVKKRLYIVVASDRGLAGAYNSNVFKAFARAAKADQAEGIDVAVISIGRQAGQFVARLKGVETVGSYTNFPDEPDASSLQPIIGTALEQFISGEVDAVEVIFTEYVSTLVQKAGGMHLLPAGFEDVEVSEDVKIADFEPSAEAVLQTVTIRMLESQLTQAIYSAAASEYSMRMMAMKNATDNASGIIEDLTLEMNKARQAYITQELAEITGGAEAMK